MAGDTVEPAAQEFPAFFEAEHLRLGRAIYLLTGDPAEAEELVQEALARAYERWDRVGSMAEPAGYVYRIAANLYLKRLRRRRLLHPLSGEVRETEADPSEQAGRRIDLLAAMATLPVEQRAALVLVEYLGYDAEAAGRILGVKAVSVRVRIHRARTRLREELGGTEDV